MKPLTFWREHHTQFGLICMFVIGGLLATHAISQANFETLAVMIGAWTGYGIYGAAKNATSSPDTTNTPAATPVVTKTNTPAPDTTTTKN